MNTAETTETCLSISDDLELSNAFIPEIPQDILFPDELNKYLKDKVKYLTHENGMLHKNLCETEVALKQSVAHIESLNSQVEVQRQTSNNKNTFANLLPTNEIASSKIVELSKKLRERNSELAVFKTKCSKLEQRIIEIEKNGINKVEKPVEAEKPKNELEDQIKTLQDKLNSTLSKLCDARNSNIQLKNDIKSANKLLQQEIGDGIENVQSLTSNSSWRGRAQIVCDLQQKCNDLREKLKIYQEKEKGRVIDAPTITKADKRLEVLTKENAELKSNFQEIKKKFEAVKARNKVYESENGVLKAKVSMLMEQSDSDSQNITSLTAKVRCAQEIQNEALHKKQALIQKLEQENKSLQTEIVKQECKVDNLNAELEQRRQDVENLRMHAKQLQDSTPRLDANVIFNDNKALNQLEAERLRLVELMKITNDRLDSERSAHTETQSKFRAERHKAAKLEAKVARLHLEQQSDRSAVYSSVSLNKLKDSTTSVDRLELAEETIKSLETKLQIERQEHKANIAEFSKILCNYGFSNED